MSFVRFYRYRDKLVIPTVVQAEEGFYMDVEPVTICDIAEEGEARSLISAALKSSNQVVPTPSRTDDPGSAILERLKLRKWRLFEAEAVMFTIYLNPDSVEYYSTGAAVGGEWKVRAGKHISLPVDTESTRIVDIVIQELNEVINPDAGKSGGLMLLPPPAEE